MGSAGTTCIVASKLPMSLEMRLQEKRTRREYGRDGLHDWSLGVRVRRQGLQDKRLQHPTHMPPQTASAGRRW